MLDKNTVSVPMSPMSPHVPSRAQVIALAGNPWRPTPEVDDTLDAPPDPTYKRSIMSSIEARNLCMQTGAMCVVALITRQLRLPRAGDGPR